MTAEFALIDRIRRRIDHGADTRIGIGDDAAVVIPTAQHELVVTVDTMVDGVHFDDQLTASELGWKSVAVNLSDLAAMGATARWLLLALTLPRGDARWLDGYLDGLLEICSQHQVELIGGDTTAGPLTISITALGEVPPGQALGRGGAQAGDRLLLTGTVGDAALGLKLMSAGADVPMALRNALCRPQPQLRAGRSLRGVASAAIDLSDGLLADVGHLATASGLRARIDLAQLPLSDAFRRHAEADDWPLAVTGGDDYQLCFAVPEAAVDSAVASLTELGCPVCEIGQLGQGAGVELLADGRVVELDAAGYEHFAA